MAFPSPAPAPPPPPPPSPSSLAREAQDELASSVRVRNRLASSPDSALPRILTALLPRVLSRVGRNAARVAELEERAGARARARARARAEGEGDDDSGSGEGGDGGSGGADGADAGEEESELKARRGVDAALTGVLRYAEERARGDPGADAPWAEAVADFLLLSSSSSSSSASSSAARERDGGNDEGAEDGDGEDRRRWERRGRTRAVGRALVLLDAGLVRCASAPGDRAERERRVRRILAASLATLEALRDCSDDRPERGEGGADGGGGREHRPLARRPPAPPPPGPRRRVGPAPVGLVPADRLGRAARDDALAVLHEDRLRRGWMRGGEEEDDGDGDEEETTGAGGRGGIGRVEDARSDAAWLALDCVALLAGTRPLNEGFDAAAPRAGGSASPSAAAAAAAGSGGSPGPDEPLLRPEEVRAVSSAAGPSASASAGDGVFDLLLDLVLYWPGRGVCGGMSLRGYRQMEHRIGRLGESSDLGLGDLVELKLAALRYAAWPPGDGLFERLEAAERGDVGGGEAPRGEGGKGAPAARDGCGASRAVLLLLLACGHPVGGGGIGGLGGKSGGADEGVHRAKLGRVAGGRLVRYLDRYHVGTGALPVSAVLASFGVSPTERKKKKNKKKSTASSNQRAGPQLGIGLAYALLILLLGEAEAGPILAEHGSLRRLWQEVLGPVPADNDPPGGNRAPLSARLSAAALDFVTKHFLLGAKLSASGGSASSRRQRYSDEEAGLLVALALPAAERALRCGVDDDNLRRAHVMQRGWGNLPAAGAAALRAICEAVASPSSVAAAAENKEAEATTAGGSVGGQDGVPAWRREARTRCLSAAMAALSSVPAATEDAPLDDIDDLHRNVLPELIPYRLRGRVAAQIRGRRARNLLLPPPVVRRTAYEVLGRLAADAYAAAGAAAGASARPSSASEDEPSAALSDRPLASVSFEGPVLLLRCVIMEEEAMRPDVAAALEVHLRALKSRLRPTSAAETTDPTKAAAAAPLLPPLLSAACSESNVARLSCARWASGVLPLLDPFAACHLCAYLADDPDLHTARAARECAGAIASVASGSSPEEEGPGGGKRRKGERDGGKKRKKKAAAAAAASVVVFLDSEGGMDRRLLHARLDHDAGELARELGTDDGAAAVLLRCHDYSAERARDACRSDLAGTLERCGVGHRRRGGGSPTAAPGESCETMDGAGHKCGICLDEDLTSEDLYAMPCGHPFCRECWRSYLAVEFEGGAAVLDAVCPREGCRERVTHAEVSDLLPSMLGMWRDRRLAAFVERDPRHRHCPGPGCPMIAVSGAGGTSSGGAASPAAEVASCGRCRTSFCFGCGGPPHVPATCDSVRRWDGIFASSDFWVRKNSKPCPQCGVPIEKNHGCNHIHCTRCDCHFCWLCLTVIGADGILNRHICNRYDPSQQGGEEARNVFYVTRFEAHDEAGRFAKTRLDTMVDQIGGMSEEPLLLSNEETCALKTAADVMVQSRCFLKFSYVVAFCMPDNIAPSAASVDDTMANAPAEPAQTSASSQNLSKEAFVAHQGTLERFTEKLSALTEVDLENLVNLKGERVLRMHLRAIDFHTRCVSQYMDRIVSFLQEIG